jgi:hypothetical protein
VILTPTGTFLAMDMENSNNYWFMVKQSVT